jgi:CheY-like chemotaxis protein
VARVLIVDDSPEFCKLVALFFKSNAHEPVTALNGTEGIRTAGDEHPDVIILDYMMPDMDGWAVYEALKAEQKTSTIPVIMITAYSSNYLINRDQALRSGMADYLTKPVSMPRSSLAQRHGGLPDQACQYA